MEKPYAVSIKVIARRNQVFTLDDDAAILQRRDCFVPRIKCGVIAMTMFFGLLFSAAPARAASWTSYRKNASRTGDAMEYARPKLTPLWSYTVQGAFFASPVVYGDTVYAGSRDGSVWAWRASDGEVLWQQSTSGWVDSTPCVWKDYLIALSKDGVVYCFNRATGEPVWTLSTGRSNVSSPIVYRDTLYFMSGAPGSALVKINPATGALLGEIQLSLYGFSSPAVDGGILAVGTNDGKINIIDLDSSQTVPIQTFGGIKYITPTIKDGKIYAATDGDERRVMAFDIHGDEIWKTPPLARVPMSASSLAIGDSYGYVAVSSDSSRLTLLKFSLADGTTIWARNTGTPPSGGRMPSPVLVNDLVFIVSGDGYLMVLTSSGSFVEPFTGAAVEQSTGVWLGSGSAGSCVVSGGRVFAGTLGGRFWAFDCEKKISLTYPDDYDVAVNSVTVTAAITDKSVNDYTLEYRKETDSVWASVSEGSAASGENIAVAQWNASGVADGAYVLRLTANSSVSRRAFSRFTLNNSPAPPTNPSASDKPFDGGGRIILRWSKSADDGAGNNDVAGYKIYRSTFSGGGFVRIATAFAGSTSYEDASTVDHTTYYYRLKAYDSLSDSTEFSAEASAFSILDGKEVAPGAAAEILLSLPDGTVVEAHIPAGATDETIFVGIRIPSSIPDGGVPRWAKKTSRIYEFGATKANGEKLLRFLVPVTIKIPYSAADISGMNADNLRIYRYSEDKSEWRAVNTSFVDTSARKVGAEIPGFSLYAIMEYLPGREELISFDGTYVYPNPTRGSKAHFKYYLGDKADVTIEIYNVAGEIVARLERADNPAGIASELEWDASRVASGVYIWRIEARSVSGAVKSLKKKLAVIN
jgi:outer membrane protein assembly factor BamB